MSDYAFEVPELPQRISLIRTGNGAPRRVAEKIGMRLEETIAKPGVTYWRYGMRSPLSPTSPRTPNHPFPPAASPRSHRHAIDLDTRILRRASGLVSAHRANPPEDSSRYPSPVNS